MLTCTHFEVVAKLFMQGVPRPSEGIGWLCETHCSHHPCLRAQGVCGALPEEVSRCPCLCPAQVSFPAHAGLLMPDYRSLAAAMQPGVAVCACLACRPAMLPCVPLGIMQRVVHHSKLCVCVCVCVCLCLCLFVCLCVCVCVCVCV